MVEEKKTATIKIHRDSVPRIIITYKNKKDLFKTFQKKLKELNLPISEVYFVDWDNDSIMIRTADDLFAAVNNNLSVRMYYYTTDDKEPFTSLSSGEDDEESGKEKEPEKEGEPRSPAPARRRHRSRSASYHGSRHGPPSCYQIPWNFVPWSYMMDPRYGPMPFPPYPHHSSKSHRRRRERSCHCSCERLCKDFANL
ncbi:hypothetical protein RB195_007972 [Necator americanus]|uniref:Uncharacterized protein n=2 Tax=Necator americanus TaxID=51031 RepID=A0ABR1C1B4_NECAM|nr:hypothetical protein NECAME_14790 [Necator americanus]ETN70399.1 hypothetical protein NECAME_14790 [Necator americanus]